MAGRSVRIGEGAGYSGAWLQPAIDLAEQGQLDYLTFECLAERTIALAQLARLKDPSAGYDPYLRRRLQAVLRPCWDNGTRLITNSGAANPLGAGACVQDVARSLGIEGIKVAVVTGDDVLETLDRDAYSLIETGQSLRSLGDRVVSANAYIGAGPIAEALEQGAHVVVGGRFADPSLALGALRHAFGWAGDDWDALGAGIVVGHLTECGPQVTGGYFYDTDHKQVPDPAWVGAPIAECWADGTAAITKLPKSGGAISMANCTEQLLYEVHNPAAYLTPDVTADFSQVRFEPEGDNRVRVSGGRGRTMPETLKVVVGYRDGFIGEGQISYNGPGCLSRARLAGEVVLDHLEAQRLPMDEVRVDLIGWDSLGTRDLEGRAEPPEVRVRVAARVATAEVADLIGLEVEGLWIAGPYGGGGATRSVREIIAVGSVLVPRDTVHPDVTIL